MFVIFQSLWSVFRILFSFGDNVIFKLIYCLIDLPSLLFYQKAFWLRNSAFEIVFLVFHLQSVQIFEHCVQLTVLEHITIYYFGFTRLFFSELCKTLQSDWSYFMSQIAWPTGWEG